MTALDFAPQRYLSPLFGMSDDKPTRATQLSVTPCSIEVARQCNKDWHSRLPHTQKGPWKIAFCASYNDVIYGVALWHNPSARTLPQSWLELRRLAIAPDAPHCAASFMLARMAKWIKANMPEVDRLISYQDMDVHKGTIYKAAGWRVGHTSVARVRDRSKPRRGTHRAYRSNANGIAPDSSPKIRWELQIQEQTQ